MLVARDGEVRINFAVLQMFNTWLRDLWHPGENTILLPDYNVIEVQDFALKLYFSLLDIKCNTSIEADSDNNNNVSTDDNIDTDAGEAVNIEDEDNFEFDSAIQSNEMISENQDNSKEDTNQIADNSSLMCEICLKTFTNKRSLTMHKLIHDDRTVSCDICGKELANIKALRNHERKHSIPRNCPKCGVEIGRQDNFKRHVDSCGVDSAVEIPKYACQQCDYTTNVRNTFVRHVRTHTPKEKYHCDICGKNFLQELKFQEHLNNMHQVRTKPKKEFICPLALCKFVTHRKYSMERHIMCVHVNKKRLIPTTCDYCGKQFKSKSEKKRHQKDCNKQVPKKPLGVETIIEMLNVNMSLNAAEKLLKHLRSILGDDMITPNVMKKVRRFVAAMERWFVTERFELENKVGKKHSTYVSYCKDVPDLIDTLIAGRKVKEPAICVACDGGQGKFVICCTICDMSKIENDRKFFKDTGSKRTVILLQCDGIPESEFNLRKLFSLLHLELCENLLPITGDLKVVLKLCGIGGPASYHPCYACNGAKVCDGVKTAGRGIFRKGSERTYNKLVEKHEEFLAKGKGIKKNGPDYDSVTHRPVPFQPQFGDRATVEWLPIEPLHTCLLGPTNDCWKKLRKAKPEKIRQFERFKGLKPHGMGGTYHGPDCRRIISEEWLAELTSRLDDTSLSRPIVR